jgi:hypothetical protein
VSPGAVDFAGTPVERVTPPSVFYSHDIVIVSKSDDPIRILKVNLNGRSEPTCTFEVGRTFRTGDSYSVPSYGECGQPIKIRVYSDRGWYDYDFQ